ncbi:MAG TPA: hypothetical protein VFV84_12500 [Burkholderiales bacterium]|nr:hypothetical protein [Burkholderiales bacterium]
MNLTAREVRQLVLPLLAFVVLLVAGVSFVVWSKDKHAADAAVLAAARLERVQVKERLMRIAEEEREVREKLKVYQQLRELGILGEEQRLEWADSMKRIRGDLELPDLRYRVERQRALASVPGKPGTVDFYASMMRVDLALLHEGDLFAFLWALRASGKAYYAVRRCTVTRTGQPANVPTLAPRLRAECEIDLITIVDHGAKS